MLVSNWDIDLQRGKEGEHILKHLLEERGWEVRDVSNDSRYQGIDVDFIISKAGVEKKVECKYDSFISRTQNVAAEVITNVERGKPGWVSITQADLIIILSSAVKEYYVFEADDLKRHLDDGRRYVQHQCDSGYYKEALIKLVPLKCLDYYERYTY